MKFRIVRLIFGNKRKCGKSYRKSIVSPIYLYNKKLNIKTITVSINFCKCTSSGSIGTT